MPIISRGQYIQPYLLYYAPVNEKTKQLREKFEVDEETGYPKAYNWRALARLGQEYDPWDPYLKFDDFDEKAYYAYNLHRYTIAALSSGAIHGALAWWMGYKWYSRPYIFLGLTSLTVFLSQFYQEKTLQRQNMVNAVDVDYLQSHPERFGKIYRPKMRELLFETRYVR